MIIYIQEIYSWLTWYMHYCFIIMVHILFCDIQEHLIIKITKSWLWFDKFDKLLAAADPFAKPEIFFFWLGLNYNWHPK